MPTTVTHGATQGQGDGPGPWAPRSGGPGACGTVSSGRREAPWDSGPVEETDAPEAGTDARTESPSLADLVEEWLDWSQAAERLGVSVSKVRQLIREHQLAGAVPVPGGGQKVPAALIQDGLVTKGVPGVLTVLHDGGYDDRAALEWLFTPDDTIPGRPVDALRENRGTEIKRRAQAMAF